MLHDFTQSPAMHAIAVAWIVFWLSWLAAAAFSDRATKRAPWTLLPMAVVVAGAALIGRHFGALNPTPLWHEPAALHWALLGIVLAGFAFAWWARITLGRLWSGTITLKEGHRIVDTGPYSLVRHPIYTGILAAVAATVVAQGSPAALLAGAIMTAAIVAKAWAEERFLSRELGAANYDAYRRRVPMLVPFLPKSG